MPIRVKKRYVDRLQGYLFYLLVNINNSTKEDLKNVNIRKAMSYALDREAIATALNDGSVAAEAYCSNSISW